MVQEENSLAVDLDIRNPLRDWDHVGSRVAFRGERDDRPLVTMVITVYKRADFLAEAVASALNQDTEQPVEIIIMDDDPASTAVSSILERFPQLRGSDFTYYVNEANLGLFGNWNRGLDLARGEWVTILCDDDLLHRHCLSTFVAETARDPSIDGVIVAKEMLDQRVPVTGTRAGRVKRRSFGEKVWGVLSSRAGRNALAAAALSRMLPWRLYGGRQSRRIEPRIFFWGSVLGAPVGFVFRKAAAQAIGGFRPEEYPSSDQLFLARFADRFHLRQHRRIGAIFRIAENESLKPEAVLAGMKQSLRLQHMMAGRQAPRWWLRLSPLIMAYHHADGYRFLGARLPVPMVEASLQMKLPRERRLLLAFARFLLGGY